MVHALKVFRPHRTPPDQLEKIFVAGKSFLQEMLDKLENWQPGKSRHHYLLIGPRGIGKTNLLKLMEHRINQSPTLKNRWHPISLSEDAYSITRVTDLLLEGLRILAESTNDPSIRESYEELKYDDDEKRVADLGLDAFRRFHKKNNCGILFMVENLNRVLENQIKQKSEIHLLRKILTEEEWIVLVCTSPTFLDAVTNPEEPLFEFFHVKRMEELTFDQQQEMLRKIALLENNTDFVEHYLHRLKSQLQALYHFIGGNPRLTIMLYDLTANQRIQDINIVLDSLLDRLTPYYQDRMKEVGEQEAKLLESMALMSEGCTPTELSKETRTASKNVRSLLNRLEHAGYVRKESRRNKRTVYIIPERFFRIWHQMNHSGSAKGRIQYLLEFFISWYADPDERDRIIKGSTAAAMGNIFLRNPISQINRVIVALVELESDEIPYPLVKILRNLLDLAFRLGDLEVIEKSIEPAKNAIRNGEDVFKPYIVALQYLKSDQDPAIIERQQPEMRDAVQLLVDSILNNAL